RARRSSALALLAALLAGYLSLAAVLGRREGKRAAAAEFEAEYGERTVRRPQPLIDLLLVGAGLGALVLGAGWFVEAAAALARAFGVSELVIGITIVAAGTSLPEVATSVVASIKGERDIAVGNVVGSNIFNILAVLGISSLVSP